MRHFVLRMAMTALLSGVPMMAKAADFVLVAFGDSLTAGYGLPERQGFSPKLEAALRAKGHHVIVLNGGVSGDTTSGGLDRLEWTLPPLTQAVILELGANDMLRGLDPAIPRANLTAMIEKLRARNIPVLLAGMRAAPNLGPEYAAKFDPIYPELAKQYQLDLYPFFLNGVTGVPGMVQADGLHPSSQGVDVIVAGILPQVEKLILNAGPAH